MILIIKKSLIFNLKNHSKVIIALDQFRSEEMDFKKDWLKLYNFVIKRKLHILMLNLFSIINIFQKIKDRLSSILFKIPPLR